MNKIHQFLYLTVLVFIAYFPTLRLGCLMDDHKIIEQSLRTDWSVENIKRDFTSNVFDDPTEAPYYRPAMTLMNRLDHSIYGSNYWGWHLTNILFHWAGTLALFLLLATLGFSSLAVFFTCCLFAIHPINIDLFLVITTRGEQMGFLFSLSTVLIFLKKMGKAQWAIGLAVYLGALFSKESAVVTPLLLALIYWIFGYSKSHFKRLVPLAIITTLYLLIRASAVGPVLSAPFPLLAKFYCQAFPKVLLSYLGVIFVPWDLHYPRLMPRLSHFWFLYLGVIALLSWYFFKRKNRVGLFCIGWYIINLLPKTPTMIQQSSMMDHWVYSALPAVFLPIGLFLKKGWESRRKMILMGTKAIFLSSVVFLILLSHVHARIRGTDEGMYRWTLRFENMYSARFKLGIILMRTGRAPEAISYLEAAYGHEPENVNYGNGLALAYWHAGQRDRAMTLLKRLAKESPEFTPTINNLKMMEEAGPQ